MRKRILLSRVLIILLYIFIYVLAIAQFRYQLNLDNLWDKVYDFSIYIIITIDAIIISLDLKSRKWRSQRNINLLLYLFIAYEIFVSFANNMLYIGPIIRDVLPWPLTYSAFRSYSKKNNIPHCFKGISIAGFLICCALSVPNIIRHLTGNGRSGGVVFPVYYCFCFVPFVLKYAKKPVHFISMASAFIILIISTKRAGVVIIVLGMAFYYFGEAHIQGTLKRKYKRYLVYTVGIVSLLALGYFLIERYNISTIARFNRLLSFEDTGSGRTLIWKDVIDHFNNSTNALKVFGHGFQAVYYKVQPWFYRRLAHNSFLEIMYDYGIVGLTFVLFFSFHIIKTTFISLRNRSINAPILSYSIPGLVVLSVVSYFFEQSLVIMPYVVLWGICVGEEEKRKKRYEQLRH